MRRVGKEQVIFGIEYADWAGAGQGRIRWNKGVAEGVSFKGYEMAYASMLDGEVQLDLLWDGMRQAKSLAEPMTQQGNKKLNERRIHPCHKPVLLYKKLIQDYGFSGCRILDTHVGGGSSRIAAWEMGCDYVGFEKSPVYFEKHMARWEKYQAQGRLFEF